MRGLRIRCREMVPGRGCLVSSHKGRSAPLRTQRNQPATLTRNIHKPPLVRGWNGEGVVVGVATGPQRFAERPEVSDTDTSKRLAGIAGTMENDFSIK